MWIKRQGRRRKEEERRERSSDSLPFIIELENCLKTMNSQPCGLVARTVAQDCGRPLAAGYTLDIV